jgi:hypothetical protein
MKEEDLLHTRLSSNQIRQLRYLTRSQPALTVPSRNLALERIYHRQEDQKRSNLLLLYMLE